MPVERIMNCESVYDQHNISTMKTRSSRNNNAFYRDGGSGGGREFGGTGGGGSRKKLKVGHSR